jgi:hypothetical protein
LVWRKLDQRQPPVILWAKVVYVHASVCIQLHSVTESKLECSKQALQL